MHRLRYGFAVCFFMQTRASKNFFYTCLTHVRSFCNCHWPSAPWKWHRPPFHQAVSNGYKDKSGDSNIHELYSQGFKWAVKIPRSVELNLFYKGNFWKQRVSYFYDNIEFSYDNITMCVYLWKQVSQHKGAGMSKILMGTKTLCLA